MIYVCSSLSCKVLLRGGPFNLEFLAISVFVESSTIHFCKKFCIFLFYRPPSSSVSIFDNLCTTLQIINPAYVSNFLLIGDFNVDFCNPNHFMYSHLIDLLCSFSLTQVVPSFTHESPRGSRTLIDLALLADVLNLLRCLTVPSLSLSDHLGVSIVLKCNSSRRSTPTTFRRVWMYHNADFSQAPDIIRQTAWDSLLSDDLDHSTELWTKKFLDIMKECIPHRDLSLKRCNLP